MKKPISLTVCVLFNFLILCLPDLILAEVLKGNNSDSDLNFSIAPVGCPMAHCSPNMSDLSGMTVPESPVQMIWKDDDPSGKNVGVGCAGNGQIAACVYTNSKSDTTAGPRMIVYNAQGVRLWTVPSTLLQSAAWASTPLVAADGSVIAVDQSQLLRFSPQGILLASEAHRPGIPISPVPLLKNYLILAAKGGGISVHNIASLREEAYFLPQDGLDPQAGCFWETANTPSVMGSRAYIVFQDSCGQSAGRFMAIEFSPPTNSNPKLQIRVVWTYDFLAPSGASPLSMRLAVSGKKLQPVIIFDGASSRTLQGPFIAALVDEGAAGRILWEKPMAAAIVASPAVDPRGGFWTYALQKPKLLRLDFLTGRTLNMIDTKVDGISHSPSGIMTIAKKSSSPNDPIVLFPVTSIQNQSTFVLALDATNSKILWKVPILPGGIENNNPGQFIMLDRGDGINNIVFSAKSLGAMAFGF